MAVFWTGLPFIVNREENRRIPFIGKCIEFAQVAAISPVCASEQLETYAGNIRKQGGERQQGSLQSGDPTEVTTFLA